MRNCECGRIAVAHCVRCGRASCSEHLGRLLANSLRSAGPPRERDLAATLGDDAFYRGYWQASTESFVCDTCRKQSGERTRVRAVQQSREWPTKPFDRAIIAISKGYVYRGLSIPYADVINSWIALRLPAESVQVSHLVSAEQAPYRTIFGRQVPYAPPKYRTQTNQGWSFPRTVIQKHTRDMDGGWVDEWLWSGATVILTSGQVQRHLDPVGPPQDGHSIRLLVEMTRKLVAMQNMAWKGPDMDQIRG